MVLSGICGGWGEENINVDIFTDFLIPMLTTIK